MWKAVFHIRIKISPSRVCARRKSKHAIGQDRWINYYSKSEERIINIKKISFRLTKLHRDSRNKNNMLYVWMCMKIREKNPFQR